MSRFEPYQDALERSKSFIERAYDRREALDDPDDADGYEYRWLVRDENGELMGLIDFDREDTAAGLEVYENGDGGVFFEEGYEVHVTLGWWPKNAVDRGDN